MLHKTADQPTTILTIGDTGIQEKQLTPTIEGMEFNLLHVAGLAEAHELIGQEEIGLLVLSVKEISQEATDEIERIRRFSPQLETLIMADLSSDDLPAALLKDGVDFVDSGASPRILGSKIRSLLQHRKTKLELLKVREHVAMTFGLDNIVGLSEPIRKLRETLARVATTDITILLKGPVGCGRKLIARTIHHHSKRRKAPFVAVDCSTMGSELLQKELFGQGDGSPGFDQSSPSLLKQADGATLFIHEIDLMPKSVQQELVQFLATYQLPSQSQPEGPKADIRLMATTTINLEQAARRGEFSEDLFSMMNILTLEIPPLRNRIDDIEPLTEYFLRRLAVDTDRSTPTISRRALDQLFGYDWPGDVGELESCLQRAASMCQGNMIDAEDIRFVKAGNRNESDPSGHPPTTRTGLLADRQQDIISRALDENNWNFTQTAAELGIGRTTLWRKVRKYNLKKQEG